MVKKKTHIVIKVLYVLFIIYMGLYIANISGYYESKIRDKVIVTEDKIKEFEKKVSLNEEIDLTSYLDNKRIDYSSGMSKAGDNLTSSLEKILESASTVFTHIVKTLF